MSRLGLACLGLAATLCACSDEAASPGASAVDEASAPAVASADAPSVAPASPPPPSLGGGSSFTATVSGLTGQVTAFQVEVTDTATRVQLAADVLFEFDSAELSAGAPEQLRRAAGLIREGGSGPIPVVGHTDAKGEDAYNDDLSLRRAQAVAAWLSTEGGAPRERLQAKGMGEREPIAPNVTVSGQDSPAGRARNRRVVLVIPRELG